MSVNRREQTDYTIHTIHNKGFREDQISRKPSLENNVCILSATDL